MPEAAGTTRHTPAPSRSPHAGNAAGRQPEAAGTTRPTPAPSARAHDSTDAREAGADLAQRVLAAADGLRPLVATAQEAQQARAKAHGAPRWTDVFTTQFTEFSNRPRL